jgi:signal transduction histidine kinase
MSSETEQHAAPEIGANALPTGAEEQAELLLRLATRISSTLDVQEVLDESLAAMRRLVVFGGGAIQLVEDGALVAAATDPPMSPEARTVRIPVGEGVSGRIAATGEPTYIPDVPNDPRVHPEGRKKGLSTGVRSYFGVPLIAQGAPIGVLQIDAPEVDAFGSSIRTLVLAFTPTIAAAVQNAWHFEQEHEAMRRLREAERLKEDFVSIVSHELRTPLTTMQGFAELLANRAEELSREQSVHLAERIVRAGRRLERLISDLLYVSRLEQGFVPVELEPTSVATVVQAVARELGAPHHPLEIDVPDALPLVLADPDRLHQVVLNLVGNAVKFSEPDEAVRIVARDHGQQVELAVEDHGRGIPPEARTSIFELFYQAEAADTRSAGGLGIGLYVVKRLCDAMAVPIEVEDAAAGGTRIAIRLGVAAT